MTASGRGFWDAPVAFSAAAGRLHTTAAIASPYEGNSLDLTLFVYCYNQESTIVAVLDTLIEAARIVGHSYEIIVIDDGSRDRSVELLRSYAQGHPTVNIVLRFNRKSKGLAQNYTDAAFIGCGKYFRLIPTDCSESMETLVDILKTAGEADIIAPYYIPSIQESAGRELVSLSYTRLLNLVSGNRINDYGASPVHLRFNVIRWHSDISGAGFEAGLLCRLLSLGFTCKQVPCRTLRRPEISWKQLVSVPLIVVEVVLRRLSRDRP